MLRSVYIFLYVLNSIFLYFFNNFNTFFEYQYLALVHLQILRMQQKNEKGPGTGYIDRGFQWIFLIIVCYFWGQKKHILNGTLLCVVTGWLQKVNL